MNSCALPPACEPLVMTAGAGIVGPDGLTVSEVEALPWNALPGSTSESQVI
jgi:hypothetical protein